MKGNMNLALNKSSIDQVEWLLAALTDFIDTLKQSKKTLSDNISFCRELRTNRKKFEKSIRKTVKCFNSLPENKQVEVELVFHQSYKKLLKIVPELKNEIDNDNLFFVFSFFLKRELNKTLRFFKKSQLRMSVKLYSDPTERIMKNPKLQQQLIDQWGSLAEEEY